MTAMAEETCTLDSDGGIAQIVLGAISNLEETLRILSDGTKITIVPVNTRTGTSIEANYI